MLGISIPIAARHARYLDASIYRNQETFNVDHVHDYLNV